MMLHHLICLFVALQKGQNQSLKMAAGDNMGDRSTDELLGGKGVELREEFSASEIPASVLLFDLWELTQSLYHLDCRSLVFNAFSSSSSYLFLCFS